MKKTIIDLIDKMQRDNLGAYAAQATLFFIMSLIPMLLILLSMIQFTPITEEMILQWINIWSPEVFESTLISIVEEVYHNSLGVMFFTIAFACFTSAKTIHSLQYCLNIIYETHETRNWFTLRFWAILETILLVIAMLGLMLLALFGKLLQDRLEAYLPFLAGLPAILLRYRLVFVFFALILVLTWIYKVLPDRPATFRSQLPGGILCSLAWYIFSYGISFYMKYFDGFSLYGSLTTLVLTMFWMYFSMFIFLICGEINNEFELLYLEYRVIRKKKKDREIFGIQ